MLTAIRRSVVVGTLLTVLAVLLMGSQSLFAQTTTGPTTATPGSGEMEMDMATPAANASMDQMMEQCMAMMMGMMATPGAGMNGMMGNGEMSGMMATPGAGMNGMMDMATPAADASMDQMMEQCMAMMMDMMGGEMSGMMATPGAGMDGMGTPVSGT